VLFFIIISDIESKCVKYKPGFEGVDINVRLAQHRSTSPGVRLELLIYGGVSDCKLMEKAMLTRYLSRREYINHEWVYKVKKDHIISSVETLIDFLV
jgi:hypothetical protein